MIREHVTALHAYVPGEQPQESGWVKLNTNENPFMAPQIAEAVAEAATDALRLYPDPLCRALRSALSHRYAVPPEQIICGNGSDELLTLAVRVAAGEGDRVAFPDPSYTVYETLTQIQNALPVSVPLGPSWELPVDELAAVGAKLTFVANPNAPTGTPYTLEQIDRLASALSGLLVVDEAYVDFGGETALPLIATRENVLVLRTMSKAFGLAGVRLGYGFGSRSVVEALYKIKDSYNLDRLTQVAGVAALAHYDQAMRNNQDIASRRDRTAQTLAQRYGWRVWPSAANFLLVDTSPRAALDIYKDLIAQRVLVRYFNRPRLENSLRISIGAEDEMAGFLSALDRIL
ncbi:MAG TPA: histidinol-phosphate transaminase [Chloroflexota bacterium]|nr:histidinol-phosphate transaminase [Chloroflexota bacterium]